MHISVSSDHLTGILLIKNNLRYSSYFLHMTQSFFGAGLCENDERQVVEQKRWTDPFRWYAVWPFCKGFLQLAHVTLTCFDGCCWAGGWKTCLGRDATGDRESTPGCFWFLGNEADWDIQESWRYKMRQVNNCPSIYTLHKNKVLRRDLMMKYSTMYVNCNDSYTHSKLQYISLLE